MIPLKRIKVKCKYKDETECKQKKEDVLKLLASKNILVCDVSSCYAGLYLHIGDDSSYDGIFKKETLDSLSKIECTPQIPPDLRSRKSIIIKNVRALDEYETEFISLCIEQKQSWATVSNIFRFPGSNTYKIQFDSTEAASQACREGLKIGYLSIATHQIEMEQYIPLTVCFKCYKVEEHTTRECKKPPDYKVCSVCSKLGHLWHECPSDVPKCLLCDGEHPCVAMRCPVRKAAIKKKKDILNANKVRPDFSYLQAASNNHIINLGSMEKEVKIATLMAYTLTQNDVTENRYSTVLNSLLTINNLPLKNADLRYDMALKTIHQTLKSLLSNPVITATPSPLPPPSPSHLQSHHSSTETPLRIHNTRNRNTTKEKH